jgi:hypothetical protein
MLALDRGWIPQGSNLDDPKIMEDACRYEDDGEYYHNCIVMKRPPQLDLNVRNGIKFCLNVQDVTNQSYNVK